MQGVQFDDGACAIRWVSDYPSNTHHDSIENVIAVHGHGGKTVVEWIDPEHPVAVIPAKLGWSSFDTGPEQMRLYALDAGPSPRWAKPHARVVETAIRERFGLTEGMRVSVVVDSTERF